MEMRPKTIPGSSRRPYPTTHRRGSASTKDLAMVDHTWSSGADVQNLNHRYSQTSNRHPQSLHNPDVMPSGQEQYMTTQGALSFASMPDVVPSWTRLVGQNSIPSPHFWGAGIYVNSATMEHQEATSSDESRYQFGQVQPPGSDRSGYQGASCSQNQQALHEYTPNSSLQGYHGRTTNRSALRDQGYGLNQYLTRFDVNHVSSSTSIEHRSDSQSNRQDSRPRIVVQEAQGGDWHQQSSPTQTLEPSLGYPLTDGNLQTSASGDMVSSYPQRRISNPATSLSTSSSTQESGYWTDGDISEEPGLYDQSVDGRLTAPRTARRDNRDEDTQPRRRHLTPEGRQHAKEVRRARACQDCHRRKIKCKHVLARDRDDILPVRQAHVGPRASPDSCPSGHSPYDSRFAISHPMRSLAPIDYSSYNLSLNHLPQKYRNESGIDRYYHP